MGTGAACPLTTICVGGVLLAHNFVPEFDLSRWWPLLLIGGGSILLLDRYCARRRRSSDDRLGTGGPRTHSTAPEIQQSPKTAEPHHFR